MKEETLQRLDSAVKEIQALYLVIQDETNKVIATQDHVQLITHFAQTRGALDKIKHAREGLEEIADFLSKRDIPDLFRTMRERTGQKPPFYIEGIGRCTVSYRYSASIIEGKKPEAFEWLRGTNNGSLITEVVNSQTLSSFAKKKLEDEGEELPEDLFRVGTQPYTSITKA